MLYTSGGPFRADGRVQFHRTGLCRRSAGPNSDPCVDGGRYAHPLFTHQIRQIYIRNRWKRASGESIGIMSQSTKYSFTCMAASWPASRVSWSLPASVRDSRVGRRVRTGRDRRRGHRRTSLSAGGIGTIPGTIVGALIIGVLNNTLDLMTYPHIGNR